VNKEEGNRDSKVQVGSHPDTDPAPTYKAFVVCLVLAIVCFVTGMGLKWWEMRPSRPVHAPLISPGEEGYYTTGTSTSV
jgi:hypothetical protein